MFFLRLVIVQMRPKEKVGLVLLAVIFYKTACSSCVPHNAEENPFEKYTTKIKRGKIQFIPKHGIYDKENGRKSIDVLSDSTLLDDMRKEKRRKRKNKPNEKVYSRDDLPLTLPESFRNQESTSYLNEMGSFPEVQYPLTASEIWAPSYWNQQSSNKEEPYSHRDYLINQNKKEKKKNIEAFLKPSIMKTILKAQEKKAIIHSVDNHIVTGEVNKIFNETIIKDDISDSSSITKKPQGKKKTSNQPLAIEKTLKKAVAKAQHATSASKKLLTESIASHSRSNQYPKKSNSNNKEFIIHESDTNNATDNFVAKDQIEILDEELSANKESVSNSKLIDAANFHVSKEKDTDALINAIKTYDQNSSRVMTDNDSNQLELLLAITASEPLMESNATPAYATDEKVLQTSSISNSITVLFNDSVRQSIFDVLSTEKLNASSLRENILKILLTEEQSPILAADVDIVDFPLNDTMIDIIGLPITEEAPETTKEVGSHSSWTETNDDGIQTTQQPIEISLTESTRSGELETTSTDKSIPEIPIISSGKKETQTPSSTENVSDLILTNDLADSLREIISKPSDSHSLVNDLREIIHLLTIWNSHIDDADKKNNNTAQIDDFIRTVPISSTITEKTTTNNTLPTDRRTEVVLVKSAISKDNQIDKVSETTFSGTPKDDHIDKVAVLTTNDTDIVSGVTTSDTSINVLSVNKNPLNTSSNTSNDQIVTVFEDSTNENRIDDLVETDSAIVTVDTSTNAGIDQVPKVIISNISSEDNSTLVFVDTPRSTPRNNQPVSASDMPVQDKYNKTSVSTNNISTDDRSGIVPVTTSSDTLIDDQTNIFSLAKSDKPTGDRFHILAMDTPNTTENHNRIDKSPEAKSSNNSSDNLSNIIPAATANDTRKDNQPDVDPEITPSDIPSDGQADTVINDNPTDDQSGIVPAVTSSETLDQTDIIIVSTGVEFLNDERSDTVSNTLSNISTDVQNIIVPVSITNENQIGDWSDTASLNTSSDLPTNEQLFIAPVAIISVPTTDELYEIIHETAPNDTPSDNQIYIAPMATAMDNRTHDWSDVKTIDTPNDTLEADQFERDPVNTSRDDRINIVPVATIRDPQTINESIVDSKEIIIALTDNYGLTDKSSLNTSSDLPTNEQIFIAPVALPESAPKDTSLEAKISVGPMATAMENQTHDWTDVLPRNTPNDSPEADQIKISPVYTSRDERISIVSEATITGPQIFNESTADSEEIVIGLTDFYGSIDKSVVDQTKGHALKSTNPSKTIIDTKSYKNDDTWASKLSTFSDPGTVLSLAQEEEYSKSLMSFISNYMTMTNTLKDNPTKTPSKTISDPDFLTNNALIDSINNDNSDLLNENLAQDVFFNKNINKVSPNDFDNINSTTKILPEPTSDYVTDSVKSYLFSPLDLEETIINDLRDIITNQNFNETITGTDSPLKFTFNDIFSAENDSLHPISFVSTYMTNDNETFLLTQNDTNTYTLLKDDLYDINILESDKKLIQNMCPIIEDTSLENQCYIYENSDVFNSTSNHTEILSGELLSNAKSIDSLAEDFLNKDTPISQEILDFTDYYTLSPDDTTTDFYDSALFSEFMDSKYQDSKKLTSDLVYDVFDMITKSREEDSSPLVTNELLDEPAITEDSDKDISSKKEMDKRSSINHDDLPQGNDKSEASKIMKDEIRNSVSSELKTPNVSDELQNKDSNHNIQESSHEDKILYDSEDIPEKLNKHDLADSARDAFSDRLYNIFPKLEFLM